MTTAGLSSFLVGSSSYSLPGAVERNQDATLYIGNLDAKVDEEILWELFTQCGPLSSVSLPRDRVTSCHQGFAFVEYKSTDDADYAVKVLNLSRLYGKPIRCNKSSTNVDKGVRGPEAGANVFVGGLAVEIDEPYLADTFSAFGSVMFAKIVRDPETGTSKGYGFVTFDSFSAADTAISRMNGQFLGNRVIAVSYAQKSDSKETHGSAAERLIADLRTKTAPPPNQPGMANPNMPPSFYVPPPPRR